MSQEVIDDLRKQLEEANKKAEQNVGGLSAEQFKTFMESRDKGEKDKEKEKEDDYITMGAEGGDGQPLDNSLPLVLNYTGDLPVNNDVLFLIKHKIYVPISLFDNDVINKATASFRQLLPSSFTGTKPLDKARESLGVYHKLSRLLPLGKFLPAFLKNVRAFIAIRVKDEATRSAIYSDAVSFSLDLLNRSAREGTWPLYREYAVDKIEGWMAAFERGASASQNKLTPWDDSLFTKACANLNVSGANDASFKPETSGPATSAWGMMVKLAYETNGSSRLDKVVEQEKSIAAKTIQGVQPAGLVPANLFFKPSFPFMDGASFAFTPPPAAPSFPKQNKGYGGGGYGGGGYGGGQPKFGGGGFPSQVGPQYQAPTFAQQRYTPYPQIKTEQQQQQQPQPPIPTANANTRCITCGGLGHFFKVCPSRGTRVQRQGLEFVTPWPENGGSRTAAPSAVPQGFVPATPAVPDLSADRTEAKEKVSHALHYIPVSL